MAGWYVLFAKPGKEAQVREQLARKGIRAYLPLLPPSRRRGGRRIRPLFPRYLFAQLDLEHTPSDVKWIPGLSCMVSFGGDYAVVSDELVEHIKSRLSVHREKRVRFAQGERVTLPKDHPLAALDAVFDRPLSAGKRAIILIKTLGRIMRVDVDAAMLEPAETVI